MPIERLQKKVGFQFRNLNLLQLALTHSSYVHEKKLPLAESNERLEFLGDAVLGLCIAEMLTVAFPDEPEGALSKRRAALVNQKQLSRLAVQIEIGPALRLGKGEEKTGGRTKASLLGDAFEAVIGAIYLDHGLEAVKTILAKLFGPLIPESKKVETSQDYKTRLQEYYQRKFKRSPRYIVTHESGPDHSKTFDIRIEFMGEVLSSGSGSSKREAEQAAAKVAFEKLGDEREVASMKKSRKRKNRPSQKRSASTKGAEDKESFQSQAGDAPSSLRNG